MSKINPLFKSVSSLDNFILSDSFIDFQKFLRKIKFKN